jgi:exopolysaccharide biosynthesis protein
MTRCLIATLIVLFIATAAGGSARELRFASPVLGGVRANIVVVDLKSPNIDVRPVVAGRPPLWMQKRYRTFSAMVKITGCLAAINGTFFDPRTASTLGSMVYQGKVVHEGYVGNAVAVDQGNHACYLRLTDGIDVDWSKYRFAIAAGPTLIHQSRIVVHKNAEGFHDPHLFHPARRSAIGFRSNGEMILMTVQKPVSLHKLARMMKSLGAHLALNLDGGSSSAMYYRGKWVTKPKRKLTNILAVLRV